MNDTVPERAASRRLQDWLARTGLTQVMAARALGVDAATMRDWCAGSAEPPKMAFLALELLAQRSDRDRAAIAAACRIAAAQALESAGTYADFTTAKGMKESAERYVQIALRYEPQFHNARVAAD